MKTIYSLYNNRVKLVFDDSNHTYSVDGKIVYGVTNITSVISKPSLIYWAAKKGAEVFLESVRAGEVLDEVQINEIANKIKTAHSYSRDRSADIGTMLHSWIEEFLKAGLSKKSLPKKPVNPEMRNAIDSFFEWTKKNKVKFIESERKIYSIKYKYAGTLDAFAVVGGKLAIIDFKTTNSIYPEMWLQTAAYQQAIQEELGKKVEKNIIVRLSKANPQEGIEPFDVLETENFKENFRVFLACKAIYEWQMKNRKREILEKVGN